MKMKNEKMKGNENEREKNRVKENDERGLSRKVVS
jgi:hypothetical protein